MVKQLRRKFVITAMGALLLIIVVLVAAINLINFYQANRMADDALYALEASGGSFRERGGHAPDMIFRIERPDGFGPDEIVGIFPGRGDEAIRYGREAERPYNTRYFTVSFWQNADGVYETVGADMSHIAALTDDEALTFAQKILQEHGCVLTETTAIDADGTYGRRIGNVGIYRYMINNYIARSAYTTRIYFIDRSDELFQARRLFLITVAIGLCALCAMFLLVWLLSKRAVSPVVESMEKQKRFITDAGHELKTPLSVISANVDVLELEQGENEWTRSIRGQTKRLTELTGNLLTLSRMEEDSIKTVFAPLNFSAVAEKCRNSFTANAEERALTYTAEIEPDVMVNGDADALYRLCALLIDNAIKYCADQGVVQILLETEQKTARLEVSNPCEIMPDGNLDRLFDRFYRADASRSKKRGGYGIGLSVAKAIAESHGGKIKAEKGGERTIRFVVTLPRL